MILGRAENLSIHFHFHNFDFQLNFNGHGATTFIILDPDRTGECAQEQDKGTRILWRIILQRNGTWMSGRMACVLTTSFSPCSICMRLRQYQGLERVSLKALQTIFFVSKCCSHLVIHSLSPYPSDTWTGFVNKLVGGENIRTGRARRWFKHRKWKLIFDS